MPNNESRELQAITKELKELNRRLDRLCRASIFSIDTPVIIINGGLEPGGTEFDEGLLATSQDKQLL